MLRNDIEFAILVKGRRITEYNHRGQVFVEGRAGSNYEIEIRNNSSENVEAVISVDGLSVTDGKPAGAQSSGYLINARSSVIVPGWTLDNSKIAKFGFSAKEKSYATQGAHGDPKNNGVIGVMVFKEKHRPVHYGTVLTQNPNYYFGQFASVKGVAPRGIAPSGGGSWSSSATMNSPIIGSSVCHNAAAATPYATQQSWADGIVEQSINSLGTAFGESADFRTTKVDFQRGDMLMMGVIYYDNARGLKARGIEMTRPSKQKYQSQPEAFPADQGCVPPPGWRG